MTERVMVGKDRSKNVVPLLINREAHAQIVLRGLVAQPIARLWRNLKLRKCGSETGGGVPQDKASKIRPRFNFSLARAHWGLYK